MDFLPIPTILNLLLSSHCSAACIINHLKHLQRQFLAGFCPLRRKKNRMISKAKNPIFEVAPEQGSRLHELCGSFNCLVMAALLPGEHAEWNIVLGSERRMRRFFHTTSCGVAAACGRRVVSFQGPELQDASGVACTRLFVGVLHCRCGLELHDHFGRFLILDHRAFIRMGCVLFRCTSHAKQLWRQALLFVRIVSKPGALLLAYPITATQWRLWRECKRKERSSTVGQK